jgi:transcriptional regulator with XRE-family HTH domain
MKRTIVLKRLSASDLTIFEHQYRTTSGSKQKGINLDKAVFLEQLYPSLKSRLATSHARVPQELHIYGPGSAGLHTQMRKILLQAKNIRLNGEFIKNPIDEPGRYDNLFKDDLAIIEFTGDESPTSAKMLLLSQHDQSDQDLYQSLMGRYGSQFSNRKAMLVLADTDLSQVISSLDLPKGHPALDFLDGEALEDAAQGGIDGVQQLRRRRNTRGVSQEELARAKQSAEQNGRLGEELLNAWLEDQTNSQEIPNFIWIADENAIAPFDFRILNAEGNPARSIDAKSTSGRFSNKIHISLAELEEMVLGDLPYDIYRLYGVGDNAALCRVAENIGSILQPTLSVLANLPNGVTADGISIDPSILPFGDEFEIDLTEPDDT